MKILKVIVVMTSCVLGSALGARVTVSATEAGCNGHRSSLPGQSSGCGGAANLTASEAEVATSVTNAGSEVEIFKLDELFDQCCEAEQTYNTSPQTYEENNSVTTNKTGTFGPAAYGVALGQIGASAGTTNGYKVTIGVASQTIAVPADSAKRFKVSIKKLQGKQLTTTNQYYCKYTVSIVTPSSPCGGYTTGDVFEVAAGSGSATTDILIWNTSAVYNVKVEECPGTP